MSTASEPTSSSQWSCQAVHRRSPGAISCTSGGDGLAPVRERYHELRADSGELERILAAGADKARSMAAETLADVREVMGVGAPR